jgi:hypothetical protein
MVMQLCRFHRESSLFNVKTANHNPEETLATSRSRTSYDTGQ